MAMIATDGACKRNGKPDCISGYGVAVKTKASNDLEFSGHEFESTSQRGELFGMLRGLSVGLELLNAGTESEIYIITDSAYMRNCICQKWYTKWQRLGWIKSDGEPVKNPDLWEKIVDKLNQYNEDNLHVFIVKGHIDYTKPDKVDLAMQQFIEANDGVQPPREVLIKMLMMNDAADKIAVNHVTEINAEYLKTAAPQSDLSWE